MSGLDDHGGTADVPKSTWDELHSLSTTQEGETEITGMADETTGLLGAGTRDHQYDAAAAGSADARDAGAPSRRDSWDGHKEYDHLPWYRRPSVYWLLPPYALFTLAFGCSIVPKLNLIIDLVCQRYFAEKTLHDDGHLLVGPVVLGGENPQCKMPEVQQHVAEFTLVLNVIVGTLSAYTAPKIGSLSDRYGRKRLLALASFGGVLAEVVTICAARFPDAVHYRWLILGNVFDGLAGSFTAGSVLSHSYTSDCTPPSRRGVAIGYLHSCLFSGLAFGPLLAGYFVKWTGSLLSVFYVTLGCHIFFILCVSLVVPESVSRRRQLLAREKHAADAEKRDRRTREWASAYLADADAAASSSSSSSSAASRWLWSLFANPKYANLMASLRSANPLEPLKVLAPRGPENARVRRNLVLLALTDMVILGAAMSSGQVTLLYSEYIFGWGNFETSRFISLVSMVRVLVLLAIFPVVNYLFRTRPAARRRRISGPIVERNAGADDLDVWILRFAILSDVIGLAGYIFARTEALFVLSGVITAFGGLGSATIQSMISKHMPAERTGALLGAVGLLHALSRIIAPVVFNGLYAATVKTFPQAVFVALTSVFLVILVLSTMVRPHVFMRELDGSGEGEEEPERPNPHRADTLSDDEVVPQI